MTGPRLTFDADGPVKPARPAKQAARKYVNHAAARILASCYPGQVPAAVIEGVRACALHVATYTATQAAALLAADRLLGLGLSWRRATAGLAISAATHYLADRQGGHWRDEDPRGVVKLAASTGHAGWLQRDPGAGYLMDQSWHKGWIAVAAAVIGGGP